MMTGKIDKVSVARMKKLQFEERHTASHLRSNRKIELFMTVYFPSPQGNQEGAIRTTPSVSKPTARYDGLREDERAVSRTICAAPALAT